MSKNSCSFIVNGERVSIVLELRAADKVGFKTIDLKPVPKDAVEVSLTGTMVGSAGQISDTLRGIAADNADIKRLCDLWDRWHLNGMKAGNRAQNEFLALHPEASGYDTSVSALTKAGLLESGGYKYGSAWLFEVVPSETVADIKAILTRLDGQRLGEAPDVSDAPEVDGDVIDSRDVIKRLEIYREAVSALGLDPSIREADLDESDMGDKFDEACEIVSELNALTDLENEASDCGDWEFGATLIRDGYFREYAEELAEDIGAINRNATWPNDCIDWEKAADQLKQDYSAVTFKGETYWVRS